MKIPFRYAKSTRNGSSLRLLSTLVWAAISLFFCSFSVSAEPLLNSAFDSFAVPDIAGVTNFPNSNINQKLSLSVNIFDDEKDNSETSSSASILSSYPPVGSDVVGSIADVGSSATELNIGSIDQADNIQSVAAVPEPATLALLGLGLAGLGFARRRHG